MVQVNLFSGWEWRSRHRDDSVGAGKERDMG